VSDVLLNATDLRRAFGGVTAVAGVTLAVGAGEIHCIIGPNGAGKSTLLNMLCGALAPTSGSIRFEDRDLVGLPVHSFARAGITRKFQVPSVFDTMPVRDNLEIALPRHRTGLDRARRIAAMLDLLSLSPLADVKAGTLAHGQKQWLEIGMALMPEPRLLLLDEPTAGMTPEETQRTAQLLLSLEGSISMIAIEHDMSFVRALDRHTMVMHQGSVIAEGEFAAIERNETVRDVYLGRQ
jgi:urea ABC transporter ATP-binding protein UrtD